MALSAKEEVCIVDEENNVIGKADRVVMMRWTLIPNASARSTSPIVQPTSSFETRGLHCISNHRAYSNLDLMAFSGKFYVQRRTMLKDYCPGMLDPVSGGVVQDGEPLDVSAQREAEEEMGVKNTPLRYLTTFYYEDKQCRVWGGLYDCTFDGPVILQKEEVDDVLLLTADEILARRKDCTPDGIVAFEKYLEWCRNRVE